MANWIDVGDQSSFSMDSYQVFNCEPYSLLIINQGGVFYAIENNCPHENQPLAGGDLEGDEMTCPVHGAAFCIKTGAVTRPPAYSKIKTYPVRVYNKKIQVDLIPDT